MRSKRQNSHLTHAIVFLSLLLVIPGEEGLAQKNTDHSIGNSDINTDIGQAPNFDTDGFSENLLSMSLEELLNLEVTSVSKKKEKWSDSAAAIYVVTADDIRRSGATTIPDALRMVPGVNVAATFWEARVDWTVGARGFSRPYSNKFLILVDGRSIYQPTFGGVYWNAEYSLPQDLERIEVIRGPGSTLWGANAVNGIINIITKSARETQGLEMTSGFGKAGSLHESHDGIRYGGQLDEHTWYRVYGQYHLRDRYVLKQVFPSDTHKVGFRMDRYVDQDRFTLQSDWTQIETETELIRFDRDTFQPGVVSVDGVTGDAIGHVLARWTRELRDDDHVSIQFYWDRFRWNLPTMVDKRDCLDLDFQHDIQFDARHQMVWGLGYRYFTDEVGWRREDLFPLYDYTPEHEGFHLVNAFVQHSMQLVEDELDLIVGSKFEYNDFTGIEVQPNVRMLWKPHEDHTLWGAISRSVRTPTRADRGILIESVFDTGTSAPGLYRIVGNEEIAAEELIAYELGYRVSPLDDVFFDMTAFYHDYDQLVTGLPMGMDLSSDPIPHVLVEQKVDNVMEANSYGLEIAANWQIAEWWKVAGGYTYLHVQVSGENRDMSVFVDSDDSVAGNQANLRSMMNLPHGWEFDVLGYYVDNVGFNDIPHYLRLDLRLGWHINEHVDFSVVGRNLIDSWHPEYDHTQEIPCGFYSQLTLRF